MTSIKSMDESTLYKYMMDNFAYQMRDNQDWMYCISGREGSSKSTLATWMSLTLNPDFDVRSQVIYDLKSFLAFLDKYADDKGRVALLDEACLHFLGEESNSKESKMFKKIFITHRDLGHVYILCAPSPWLLTPYIRQWRVRDFILTYVNPYSDTNERYYAYYNKKAYVPFITNVKAKMQIMMPFEFVKIHKPTEVQFFPKPSGEKYDRIFAEIFAMKKEAQRGLRAEALELDEESGNSDEAISKVDDMLRISRNRYVRNLHKEGVMNKTIAKAFDLKPNYVSEIINNAMIYK